MGSIRTAVQEFDSAPAVAAEQRELVEALSELAQAKADYFDLQIQDLLTKAGTSNKTVPIESIVGSTKETHAFSANVSDHIVSSVSGTIETFITNGRENVLSAVSGLLSNAVTAFLGEGTASSDTMEKMYVVTEGLSIVRFDVKGWYQNVETSAISNQIQRVSAFVGVKSTVDVQSLKFNTFLNLYQGQLMGTNLTTEVVKTELEAAREVYNLLRGEGAEKLFLPQSIEKSKFF